MLPGMIWVAVLVTIVAGVQDRCYSSNTSCFPTQEDFDKLGENVDLILPSMRDFSYSSAMRNTRFKRNPAAVVMAESTTDVQRAVLFARKFNLHVTVRSSGHDFIGRSSWAGSFLINLRNIKDIHINLTSNRCENGEVKVGTGNMWDEIYEALNGTGRVVVGGSSPTVSPGGYTQGGGHSPLSRMYGLAVDNVLEMEVVLPDGRIATCTENQTVIQELDGNRFIVEDGDLFWALRGGGGGTYGIVSHYTYKLYPDPDGFGCLLAILPIRTDTIIGGESIGYRAMNALNSVIPRLPREYSGYVVLHNLPSHIPAIESGFGIDVFITGTITFVILKHGHWPQETPSFLAELENAGRDRWLFRSTFNYSNFYDYQKNVPVDAPGQIYLMNSLLQEGSFKQEFTDFMMNVMLWENHLKMGYICTHTLLGGAVGNTAHNSTPVHPGFRTAASSFSCAILLPGTLRTDQKFLHEGAKIAKKLRHYGKGEYLNEPDLYNTNWKQDYWAENYPALLNIKNRYDPENFFTCYHCVGSTMPDLHAVAKGNKLNGVVGIYLVSLFTSIFIFR